MPTSPPTLLLLAALVVVPASSCGDDGTSTAPETPTVAAARAEVQALLADSGYKSWFCEGQTHAPRHGSPHGPNRICTNDVLTDAPTVGEYPIGARAVKEIYDDKGTLTGHAAYVKIGPSAAGSGWYWYEKIGDRVFADAAGSSNCTGCHGAAGSSAERPGRDYVYTRVPRP